MKNVTMNATLKWFRHHPTYGALCCGCGVRFFDGFRPELCIGKRLVRMELWLCPSCYIKVEGPQDNERTEENER